MKSASSPGTLVVSLDFELLWGMFDKATNTAYEANIKGVHDVVPQLLELFTEYDIHATWATVGMLTYPSATDLQTAASAVPVHPAYEQPELSAYIHSNSPKPAQQPELYFAPELVAQIAATPQQEIASHTFAHYYCQESQTGDAVAAFAADCHAQQQRFSELGHTLTSLVFPRNQWSEAAIRVAAAHGLTAVRGCEDHFLYRSRTEHEQTNPIIRALRLLDHYVTISGQHTYKIEGVQPPNRTVCNIPASRFLRPVSRNLRILEPLRRRRITTAMTQAAQQGEIFHLWWHPHNFGADPAKNLTFLRSLLNHYKKLQRSYGMQSQSMHEVARQFFESNERATADEESATRQM